MVLNNVIFIRHSRKRAASVCNFQSTRWILSNHGDAQPLWRALGDRSALQISLIHGGCSTPDGTTPSWRRPCRCRGLEDPGSRRSHAACFSAKNPAIPFNKKFYAMKKSILFLLAAALLIGGALAAGSFTRNLSEDFFEANLNHGLTWTGSRLNHPKLKHITICNAIHPSTHSASPSIIAAMNIVSKRKSQGKTASLHSLSFKRYMKSLGKEVIE